MLHDMDDFPSMEDVIMMKDKPLSMPKKKTKIADSMEELERFALRAAESKAFSSATKAEVKKHVRMIREVLASEYTK